MKTLQAIFSSNVPRRYVLSPITHSSMLTCPSLSRSNALKTIWKDYSYKIISFHYLDPWEYHQSYRMYYVEYHENDFDQVFLGIKPILRTKFIAGFYLYHQPWLNDEILYKVIRFLVLKLQESLHIDPSSLINNWIHTMKSFLSLSHFIYNIINCFSGDWLTFSMTDTF
jgi:hypothetical protein